MHICLYVYMYTHIYTYIYTYLYMHMYLFMYVYVYQVLLGLLFCMDAIQTHFTHCFERKACLNCIHTQGLLKKDKEGGSIDGAAYSYALKWEGGEGRRFARSLEVFAGGYSILCGARRNRKHPSVLHRIYINTYIYEHTYIYISISRCCISRCGFSRC